MSGKAGSKVSSPWVLQLGERTTTTQVQRSFVEALDLSKMGSLFRYEWQGFLHL